MDVGVRELKAKLSDYLGRAERGEDIVVTDRGRPIARLVAYNPESMLERGIADGWIEPAHRRLASDVQRFPSNLSVLEMLEADRA